MLKRIDFSVIKVSGEDENFPALELNSQRPVAKGWMSPKFCSYPQAVVVRLESRTRICKLQVLSHPYSISSKLEIYVGDVKKGMPELLPNVSWEKQGEICFSENNHTEHKARELRSAFLDIIAKFIKIVCHQNHINKMNLCNQIGLVALNVIGEIVLEDGSIKAKHLSDDVLFNKRVSNIGPLEDMHFCMYVDVEIAQLIKMLDKKKQKAVTSDRFVYAKKLKYAITQLQKVALEENDREGRNNSSQNKTKADANDMLVPMIGNYVSHDDIAVPALKKGIKTQPSVFPGSNSDTGNDLVLGKLTEKDRREASLPIEVFGLPLVEKMYSKSFNQREEAMKELKMYLEKYQKKGKTHSPSDVIRAATFLLYRAIYDKVHSIYTFALNILAFCFKIFIPTHQAPKSDAIYLMDKCLPEIINKLGDTAVRLKNASLDYLTTALSNAESEILHVLYQHILSSIRQNLNVRLAVGKCELIEKLLKQHPLSPSNVLPLSKVMPFLMDALQHPSSSVRGIAERIVVSLYDYDSKNVKKYFPSDSEISKKSIMYHRIFQTFEKVDKQKKNRGLRNENAKQSYLKSYKKKTMQPNQVSYSQNETHDDSLLMKTCIFCGEQKDIFTPEGLDKHYDQDCPMLLRCTNCRQIVEIAGLTEHLLEECEAKNSYQQCPICLEAIPSLHFENHVKMRSCVMAKSSYDANHCPLCHKNIDPGEQGWRSHLMEESGCAFNSRRRSKKDSRKSILRKKSIQSN